MQNVSAQFPAAKTPGTLVSRCSSTAIPPVAPILISGVPRKVDVWLYTGVQKYQVGGNDPQACGSLYAVDQPILSDKREHIGTGEYLDAKPAQFKFDNLGHIRIHAGQDMGFALENGHGLAQRSQALGEFQSGIARPDNHHI